MQPMTMGFQNSGKRLQYAVESRECARRVRVLKKLSKRLPLACALTAVPWMKSGASTKLLCQHL